MTINISNQLDNLTGNFNRAETLPEIDQLRQQLAQIREQIGTDKSLQKLFNPECAMFEAAINQLEEEIQEKIRKSIRKLASFTAFPGEIYY